jgi:hypothetical protein
MRVLLVALQGLVPAFAAALVWQPVDGPGSYLLPKAASLLITAAVCAGWFALGRRTWRESATVGPDAIVVRNVFRTCRVP